MKTTVATNKKNVHTFDVKFEGMTEGEVVGLRNALSERAQVSPVARDILESLAARLRDSDNPRLSSTPGW